MKTKAALRGIPHRFTRQTLYLLLISALFLSAAPALWAASGYDVSYVWSGNRDAVVKYREKVVRILGPDVAKKLKVVADDDLYGVIYLRRGDSAGASRVAESHTEKLIAGGLEAAAPTAALDWNIVSTDGSTKTADPAKKSTPKKSASNKTASRKTASKTSPAPKKPSKQAKKSKKSKKSGKSEHTHNLELAIEKYIKKLRREGRVGRDERTAWSVYDFTTGKKLVTINEDYQFQAASLIKPFVALAFFHQMEQGKLAYGSEARRHMKRMIQRSSNHSTNWVMRQVGGPRAVQRILKGRYRGIFRDTRIVEYIPKGGRTYRNKASAHDYSRFLYGLWNKTIPGARELKRLMALPGNDRIHTGVSGIPSGTRVYNKTGSTSRLCGDMGILSIKGPNGKRYSYTLIGIIEKGNRAGNYGAWIRSRGNVIREISGIVYKDMVKRHRL